MDKEMPTNRKEYDTKEFQYFIETINKIITKHPDTGLYLKPATIYVHGLIDRLDRYENYVLLLGGKADQI